MTEHTDLKANTAAANLPENTISNSNSIAKMKSKSKDKNKNKDSARIEGAPNVAIGIKKEGDFSTWYTNVSVLPSRAPLVCCTDGPDRSC